MSAREHHPGAPDGAIHPDCGCPDGEPCAQAPLDPVSLKPYAACVYCGAQWCEADDTLKLDQVCSCSDAYGCLWEQLRRAAPAALPPGVQVGQQPVGEAPAQDAGAPDRKQRAEELRKTARRLDAHGNHGDAESVRRWADRVEAGDTSPPRVTRGPVTASESYSDSDAPSCGVSCDCVSTYVARP